ncbi:MAG: dienelactone hydrolase family protein [Acidobacteria bacterium]|nr:MAG: dienelactone hydrolase family protein [Acidobacteriota bacterium]
MNNKPMNRLALTALLLLLAAIPARAGEEMVTFKSGSEDASGLLVAPAGKGPFPAVLVIQEWWGLNDWVKDQARALAREGYLALAVDLYRGKVATKQEDAHQLMMGAPPDRILRDLKAAHAFLAARPNVKKDRIGAIGWCMGGRWSLALATEIPTLAAVVAYYGAPPTDSAAIAAIKAPVLGNFGGEDKGPSPDQVRGFEDALKKAGKSVDIKIYEGAGHAFANVNNPWGGYREAAAKDAWRRTTAFLAKHLSPRP